MFACSRALRSHRSLFALLAVATSALLGTTVDVSMSAAAAAAVDLQNPSLESGQGSLPTCWTQNGWGTNDATYERTDDAHTGSWAENVSISSYESGARGLTVRRSCAPLISAGDSYTLSAWYKATGTVTWVVRYQSRDTDHWTDWISGPVLAEASDWTNMTYTTPAVPDDAARITFGLSLQSVGSVTVDDFDLTDASATPPSATPPSATPSPPVTSTTAPTTTAPTSPSTPISPTTTSSVSGRTWYVSRDGNDADGRSWTSAWNELDQIDWSVVKPGDTILLDGAATPCASPYDFSGERPGISCGMEYDTTLTVAASGTNAAPITIALATDAGHDGTAVFFGGRATPLPYCHQPTGSYTYTPGLADGIVIGAQSYVTIDGTHRSGIDVYGARQGIRFSSDSANHITVRNAEVFDNGTASTSADGWRTDAEGFSLRGNNLTFDRDLVHDNGQDEFQSENVAAGTMHDLTWTNDWIYARRENPLYPGEPFNDLQRVDGDNCTHADGIQLDSGGIQQGLTVDHDVFGPLLNQGFYPGDSGTATVFSNVTVTNSLFADTASHNIISDLPVSNWTLDHDTLFATQGGFEIPTSVGMSLTNSIKYGGYVDLLGLLSDATSSTIWYGGDALAGATNVDPQFVGPVPTGELPGYDEIVAANFTPQCSECAGKGSPITSVSSLLARIDSLNPD